MDKHKGSQLLYYCLNMRRQLNKLIISGSLTPGEYLILRHAAGANRIQDKVVRAADLSELLELSRPSITRILNGLEKRHLITRTIDPEDRRSINIELTAAGEAALTEANRRIIGIADRLVESLGEADTDKLITLIKRLTEVYNAMLEEDGEING